MATTEAIRTGEYLKSQAVGDRSIETITLTGGKFPAGQVLGKVAADGKYTDYDDAAADGTEVAAAVLYEATDASTADQSAVVHIRDCEVYASLLTGSDANGVADLLTNGVVVR